MANIFNRLMKGNDGNPGAEQQPAPQTPQPAPHDLPRELGVRVSIEHPDWARDAISLGTWPESTRIAIGRQFARVLGEELAANTSSVEQSKHTLKGALAVPVTIVDADKHIYSAIETIAPCKGNADSTSKLFQHMASAFRDLSLSERLGVAAALMRETVTKMFSQMLDAPADPRTLMSVSGDGDMKTVFGHRGRVEEMSIKMLRGYLSTYFKEELTEAQRRYDEKKATLRDGGAIRLDKVFQLTLSIQDTELDSMSTFKTTKEDLIASYTNALLRYAQEGYPKRVWKRQPRALE